MFQLHASSNLVPTKLTSALKKAENNSNQIHKLKEKSENLKNKVNDFLDKTEPLRTELDMRFSAINKLEQVLIYLKSFEKIEDLRCVYFLLLFDYLFFKKVNRK